MARSVKAVLTAFDKHVKRDHGSLAETPCSGGHTWCSQCDRCSRCHWSRFSLVLFQVPRVR